MQIPESKAQRELVPKGTHPARLINILDIGTQIPKNPANAPQRKLRLTFELVKQLRDFNGTMKPLVISRDFTFTTSEKGHLRELLLAWCGVDISKDKSFDITLLLGKAALVSVNHTDDKKYDNITSVIGVPEGMDVDKAYNPLKCLSLDAKEFDKDVFESLPDFIKDKIKPTQEYKALNILEEAPF
jgi:hypothetical protein